MLLPAYSDPATGSATGFASALNANLGAFRSNDQNIENRLENLANALFGTGVIAGSYATPLLSAGSGLSVSVKPHRSLIGVVVSQTSAAIIAVPDNAATAYLWEFQDGAHSATTTSDNPGTANNPAIKIGSCVTSSGAVTSADNSRSEVNPQTTGGLTPVGGILMWSGAIASIPYGWHLCDGTNGTPDLRSRFILGAGGDYAPGATGGATTTSGNVSGTTNAGNAQIADHPAHEHTIESITVASSTTSETTTAQSGTGATVSASNHSHNVSWPGAPNTFVDTHPVQAMSHADSGHSHSFYGTTGNLPILPPYYALAYIMRIA